MQNYYIRIEDIPSLVSRKLSIIKYVVLKKIIFYFLCFDRLIWTWTWLGLEPLWTRSWLGLEPLWTRSWLGLEPLWTWTCLGLDKGGLDYSPILMPSLCRATILFSDPQRVICHEVPCWTSSDQYEKVRAITPNLNTPNSHTIQCTVEYTGCRIKLILHQYLVISLKYGIYLATKVVNKIKSSQVTFIYIALLTIQIVSNHLHNIKIFLS